MNVLRSGIVTMLLLAAFSVQAACTWYLPSDMEKMIERTADYMKAAAPESLLIGGNASVDREKAAMASPASYVSPAAPPFLMFHGTEDRTVPFSQSQAMYEKLEAAGAQVSCGHRGSRPCGCTFLPKRNMGQNYLFLSG